MLVGQRQNFSEGVEQGKVFDIESYLSSVGIPYKTDGKNVGSNDVNICCPFCGEHRYHLGIHRTNGKLNCWVCRFDGETKKPNIIRLIMSLESIPYPKAMVIFDKFSYDGEQEEIVYNRVTKVQLPDEAEDFESTSFIRQRDLALSYLMSRGFGWEHINQYKLKFCPNGGYAYRIIVPIYVDGELVTYIGRDYTWRSDLRYKNCPVKDSIYTPKQILYPLDDFKGRHLRLVEGVTDRWRLGSIAMAIMTSKLSREQRALIISLKIDAISIIFDPGALKFAYLVAEDLSPFIPQIKVVELEDGDVADHTKDEVLVVEDKASWLKF